jgi:dTDP-4-dehydrorhamnose reductase
MKVLIVGSRGFLGSEFRIAFSKRAITFVGTTTQAPEQGELYLNLSEGNFGIDFSEFSHVLISAGIAGKKVDENKELAHSVNVEGTKLLIKELQYQGIHTTFVSSSAVFNLNQQYSDETETPSPSTEYGKQKRSVEEYISSELRHFDSIAVIRPTKIFSKRSKTINSWKTTSRKEQILRANSGVTLAPISADFLIEICSELMIEKLGGVYNVSGNHLFTYPDFISEMFRRETPGRLPKIEPYLNDKEVLDSATILRSAYSSGALASLIQDYESCLADLAFEELK